MGLLRQWESVSALQASLFPHFFLTGLLSYFQSSVSSGSVFSVPGILFPVSPRLRGSAGDRIFSRGGAETRTQSFLFLSCRNYPRETVSDRLRQPGTRDKSCKGRELNRPAFFKGRPGGFWVT
ncbi:MAG: hypothetical protein B6245_07965 [Desulfobacteraceae bacterium 4572_88]|nr:MAG: hypothetical protein B6245_07965 [Desulfobacteraceae bacterium 4572_88]RLC18377.1 MAG: hypothetical protein DRI57_08525 [Deltaproteobacteria bacterium]